MTRLVHFSDLSWLSESAAHYKYALGHPQEPTPAMRVGDLFDRMVFAGSAGHKRAWTVYNGRRQGKDWEAFQISHAHETIFTESEHETASEAASELLAGPTGEEARRYLHARNTDYQVCLEWEIHGIFCATGIPGERGGIDILGPDFIADVKLTNCTEPIQFARHARRQLWPQQLVWYRDGVQVTRGKRIDKLLLIGVESKPPHVVTVLQLTPAMIERAEQSLVLWVEKLRACHASDRWPGYSDAVQPCDVDAWDTADEEAG